MNRQVIFIIISVLVVLQFDVSGLDHNNKSIIKFIDNTPSEVATNFLLWYRDNRNRLQEIELVDNSNDSVVSIPFLVQS